VAPVVVDGDTPFGIVRATTPAASTCRRGSRIGGSIADHSHFDRIAKTLAAPASRRRTLRGLNFGLLGLGLPGGAVGKKRRKRQVRFNALGCVNVGNRCRNAGQCCSGICAGKKGKKRCRAHDTGGCRPGEGLCGQAGVSCTTSTGKDGDCAATTGNTGFCEDGGGCERCTRDRDCQIFGNNPTGACIVCSACPGGTACVFA
jgi:hypothetical protein